MILNLYEQHLDDFKTMERYLGAKKKIFENSKICVAGDGVPSIEGVKRISSKDHSVDYALLYGKIYENSVEVAEINCIFAPDSIIAAYSIAREMGLPIESLIKSIESFSGLEHRSEIVRFPNGQMIVNDSTSTNILNTINAVNRISSFFELSKVSLICGGKFFEQNLENLDEIIDRISFCGCIGSSSGTLADYFRSRKIPIMI
jgi:UDP-N-acetylmuramoylalanine--D-glutamate ligase